MGLWQLIPARSNACDLIVHIPFFQSLKSQVYWILPGSNPIRRDVASSTLGSPDLGKELAHYLLYVFAVLLGHIQPTDA